MSDKNGSETTATGQGTAAAAARESQEDARESRIADLRQRYLNGTYRVDAANVSARIVDKHINK